MTELLFRHFKCTHLFTREYLCWLFQRCQEDYIKNKSKHKSAKCDAVSKINPFHIISSVLKACWKSTVCTAFWNVNREGAILTLEGKLFQN